MTSISPWFGAASLFNVLLFIVLGTIIPYYLAGGPGPAKVRSVSTDACDGFETYSANVMQQAESFYTQCRLNASADAASCGYVTRIVDSRPQLNFTLDDLCPFEEENCIFFQPHWNWRKALHDDGRGFNKALKVAYLDMQPSDYGLNIDSRIRQSHSLTCAPLKVRWFQVPYGTPGQGNVTVLWVGYTPGHFNESEIYGSIGETVGYYYPYPMFTPGPPKLESAALYELTIYRNLVDYQRGWIYENYHPGLKIDDGDMFIVRFKYGLGFSVGTPYYNPFFERAPDPVTVRHGPETYALGCFEQYQLCFDKKCMGWSNATEATREMSHFLQSNYDHDIASEVLKVHSLLIEATSLRTFMARHSGSPTFIHSILRQFPELETIFRNSPKEQWHREVQSWFELSFLTAKFALLASVQGAKGQSAAPEDHFSNTSWICDKLLFLDNNPTNINFIGLMATLSGLLVLCLISLMGKILVQVKRGLKVCWKVCRWVGDALQRLWRDLLALAYNWVQRAYEFVAEKPKAVFQAMCRGLGLFPEFVNLAIRRSSAYRSRRGDDVDDDDAWIDDDELPSDGLRDFTTTLPFSNTIS